MFTEKTRTKAQMAGRKGYDPKFLGTSVPMPRPDKRHEVLETGFAKEALPYTHFSIVMSASRRLPIFTAENVDGGKKWKLKRKDAWGFDPRIPKSAQVGHRDFYGPEPFDKGHMVRRENPGWGETRAEAQLGEDDSFIYTNAAPQMPQLNQRTWLSLEDYILENARVEGFRISVFTGPVFADDDPTYSDVQVPREFWKVVVANDASDGSLLVAAYMLTQEGMLPEEGFRYGAFKTYLVPLVRVEESAGLQFSATLRAHDVFEGTSDEAVAVGVTEVHGSEDVLPRKMERA